MLSCQSLRDTNARERFAQALKIAGLPDKPPLPLPDKPSIAVTLDADHEINFIINQQSLTLASIASS
jgi:hypothetical protein